MINKLRRTSWRMLAVLGALLLVAMTVAACAQPIAPVAPAGSAGTAADAAATATEEATAEAGAEATVTATEEVTAEATTETAAETATEAAALPTPALPPVASGEWEGMQVGFTAEGYPFRGEPNAPITMYEFSDYQCPFCARYFVQTEPAINDNYVRTGKLRVVFRDFPIKELHPNAPAAHRAILCVAEQGADLYWAMHNKLFQTQTEWSNSTDPQPVFERLADEAGVAMDAFKQCMTTAEQEKQPIIDASLAAGQKAGVSGTPSFFFVGADGVSYPLVGAQPYDQFALYIDSMLKGEKPPVPDQQAQQDQGQQQIPFWATAEGWVPDPERPGFNMAGDEYRGNIDAKVTVIEFSDFQCPFCKQHVEETQPALDKEFVDTGKVMWVFKHFPLSIHPQAPAGAAAAECAADQGKFWEMHDALFKDQDKWTVSDPNPALADVAKEIGLDVDKFTACLKEGKVEDRVKSDASEGAPFVQGTPTFIVLYNGEGQIIPGALPLDTFKKVLQDAVDMADYAGSK
jgi:protein-disulfide isomerase